jgi:glyceraldehyde 3-phosphate dehydrogenase
MVLRVAINGFGRIGRGIARVILESWSHDMQIVAINGMGDIDVNAHLLAYDSVHGRFAQEVSFKDSQIVVDGNAIPFTAYRNPEELPWKEYAVDLVMECTGAFTSADKARSHMKAGAGCVLISAPADGVDATVVYGVNHGILESSMRIVSCASCTTNCLAPIACILHREIGIQNGYMTTIHAYTGDQRVLDTARRDCYRSRAAGLSMIPTSTGAAKALGLVIPELAGKLDGSSIRVPTPNVSAIDLTAVMQRTVSVGEINDLFQSASTGNWQGIVEYTDAPCVSIDYNHNSYSASFAGKETRVVGDNFLRVLAWYDNEWGFSHRMCDVGAAMGRFL